MKNQNEFFNLDYCNPTFSQAFKLLNNEENKIEEIEYYYNKRSIFINKENVNILFSKVKQNEKYIQSNDPKDFLIEWLF